MSDPNQPWRDLFPPPATAAPAVTLRFRLLRKRGEPLLLIPAAPALARESLSLFPAQTAKARLARHIAWLSAQTRLPVLTQPLVWKTAPATPLLRFLAADDPTRPAPFALLCGNPRTAGRRFILLGFAANGRPQKIVKAGVSPVARELIRREAEFLNSSAAQRRGIPKLLGRLEEPQLAALALEYFPGVSPDPADAAAPAAVLGDWILRQETLPLGALPAWQRLQQAAAPAPGFAALQTRLATQSVHPAVFHGDFAPWNIRVTPEQNSWAVFDWERGESAGPPGWDWFHYVIQSALLVRRRSPEQVIAQLEVLLRSAAFEQYAGSAGIVTHARQLVLAYLLYCCHVLQPAEGAAATAELLRRLQQRWLPH